MAKRKLDVPRLLRALGIEAEHHGREWVAICPCKGHDDRNPSWRIRDEPSNPKKHGSHKCFAGDVRVLTRDGIRKIGSLVGTSTDVLTMNSGGYPSWVNVPFSSFGEATVYRVHLSRNGVKKTIEATNDHEWFVRTSQAKWTRIETRELRKGDRLKAASLPRSGTLKPSPWGIAHGFTFGDGTLIKNGGASASFFGKKDAALIKFFPLSPRYSVRTEFDVEGTRVDNLPRFFKEVPNLEEASSYLYGWLAGYFAADGEVDERGHPSISSSKRENLEFVESLCLRLGVFTYGIRKYWRLGKGKRKTPIYYLTFSRSALTENFFLIDEHRSRWIVGRSVKERRGWVVESVSRKGRIAEVFCCAVPETHCFALDGFILVSNCHPCGFSGGPVELVMEVRGYVDARSAFGWLDELAEGTSHEDDEPIAGVKWEIGSLVRRSFQLPIEGIFDPLDRWVTDAREYAGDRGITAEQVDRFGLGYAIIGRLRGRIIIPSRDSTGSPRNYTARTYIGQRKRYLAADREKEKPDLGCMFGEQFWPPLGKRKRIAVLEGAINGLAVDLAAPSLPIGIIDGSEPRPEHHAKIATFEEAVVLTDSDAAGDKAAKMLGPLVRHIRVTRVMLPQGVDAQVAQQRGILREALGPYAGTD